MSAAPWFDTTGDSVPSRYPERALIAAVIAAWIADIKLGARRADEGREFGRWYSDFKKWTPTNMPVSWIRYCTLVDLEPWSVCERIWRQIAEMRDDPSRIAACAVSEALKAGFTREEAEEYSHLVEADSV